MEEAEKSVIICNRLGLHARAAGLFRRTAAGFKAEIQVVRGEITANAKSLLGLMALEASQGTSLVIRARGSDAVSAVETLCELVCARFGEPE
jgi:phosphotransferase system HPr (HPr) family protein